MLLVQTMYHLQWKSNNQLYNKIYSQVQFVLLIMNEHISEIPPYFGFLAIWLESKDIS